MRALIAILAILAMFVVACTPQTGTPIEPETVEEPETTETPTETEEEIILDDEALNALGITLRDNLAEFISPELNEGITATYKTTIVGSGQNEEYYTTHTVITKLKDQELCFGIQVNTSRSDLINKQTVWCSSKEYQYYGNKITGEYSNPQYIGRDSSWPQERVKGFSISEFTGVTQVSVTAGDYITIHKSTITPTTSDETWNSPQAPAFRSGLVKSVSVAQGVTTTEELISHN
jgi:hypothetical protein